MPDYTPRDPDEPGRAIPAAIRRFILERDEFTCRYCGALEATGIDHITPWAQGGTHHPHNLVTACNRCNSIAGLRDFAELSEKLRYVRARIEILDTV